MLRTTVVLSTLAAALVAAAPSAGAAAPPCTRSSSPPRVSASLEQDPSGAHARIVACDHRTGQRRVLRRGRVTAATPRVSATLLGRPAADGWRVIWSELVGARRGVVQQQRTVDLRRPGVTRRTVLARPRVGAAISLPLLDTVAVPGRGVAWIAVNDHAETGRLQLRRPGQPTRTLAPDATSLHVEDGRTLAWSVFGVRFDRPAWGFRDLAAPPRRDGCPVRSAFADVLVDTPLLRITAAAEGDEVVYRGCRKATGADDVVGWIDYESRASFVVADERVAQVSIASDKYQQCQAGENAAIRVVDLGTRRVERRGPIGCATHTGFVLTASGAPAWIATVGPTAYVQTLTADGRTSDLDSGPPSSLAALAATPTGFTWTHDGQPRSAPAG